MDAWDPHLSSRFSEFWHIADVLREFEQETSFPNLARWNLLAERAKLTNGAGLATSFVSHQPRKRGAPWQLVSMYDALIWQKGHVPSREGNWHDFFNMTIWRTFPKAKAAINAAQWKALLTWLPGTEGDKLPGARLPEQDALALLDEGGALVVGRSGVLPPQGADELEHACHEGRACVLLFGHALLEHVVTGEGEVRGASVRLALPAWPSDRVRFLHAVDIALSESVARGESVKRGERGVALSLARTSAKTLAWSV